MSMEEYESHYIDPVIYTRTYSLNILKKAMRRFVLIILVAFILHHLFVLGYRMVFVSNPLAGLSRIFNLIP